MATVSPDKKVIVVGGGWAGLSCAYALSQRGHQITLLEAAPQCGGRARSIQWQSLGIEVDNGQHILLGAYQAFLRIIKDIELKESALFDRRPFELLLRGKDKTAHLVCKPRWYLPKKLSLLWDLYQAKGWTYREKYRLGFFMTRYVFNNTPVSDNLSALELLKQAGQSPALIQYFWEPILVAALSTPLKTASAQYALRVLKDSFSGKPGNTDILIPTVPLGDILAKPMVAWLKEKEHRVLTHQRAVSLLIADSNNENTRCIGIKTRDHTFYGKVVLALPPRAAQILIQPVNHLKILSQQLAQFNEESIVTIYYAFPLIESTNKIPVMQAIVQDDTHYWLFCRQLKNHTLLSAVFSGKGPHLSKDKDQLMNAVQAEIQTQYPMLGAVVARKHIQEKFAAFSADKNSHSIKPKYKTTVPGLWICGDYSHAVYPATLEGAVQSGMGCAMEI
jgi:squalene-associated FAD-dependent desaturase